MRIFAVTFQKCGTHLLKAILKNPPHLPYVKGFGYSDILKRVPVHEIDPGALIDKETAITLLSDFSGIRNGHLPYDSEFERAIRLNDGKILFLIRDPRDAVVSQMYHARDRPDYASNLMFLDGRPLNDRDDPLLWLIMGLEERWRAFLPWLDRADAVVRFEGLVESPHMEIGKIWDILGIEGITDLGLGSIRDAVSRIDPSKSPTFRVGKVGTWREHFKPHHTDIFNLYMGDIMRRLGYT